MTELERLQAELAQVRTAISAAYGAAEYTIQSGQTARRVRRQELPSLIAREKELERSINRISATESGTAGSFYVGVPTP